MAFDVGSRVTWTTQGIEKIGYVIEVVAPDGDPRTKLPERGMPRNHETYVVRARRRQDWSLRRPWSTLSNYWPRTSALREVEAWPPDAWPAEGSR
mgnify:CR=1 FL=1